MMQDVADLLPGGVLVLNADYEIVYLNPFGYQLLAYEPDGLSGKRVDVLLTTASRIYFQTHLYPLIALGQVANELYLTFLSQAGSRIPVLLNVSRQPQLPGHIYFCFIPVYQRRQYEQELLLAKKAAEQALLRTDQLTSLQQQLEAHQAELDRQVITLQQQKAELEQFGRVIAHDLQEPLRKITLLASVLETEPRNALTPTGQRGLTGISKASNRLRGLIQDLQVYFTTTNLQTTRESVDLTELIRPLFLDYRSADVQFELASLPTVMGNRGELVSLFGHLLSNAVKFRQPGLPAWVRISGTVVSQNSYRTTPDKYKYIDYARIIVSDNGIGFNNQYQEEIFGLLKKLDPHSPGLGLGLSVVKKIVERHQGQIMAESTQHQGTKMTLLLPVV